MGYTDKLRGFLSPGRRKGEKRRKPGPKEMVVFGAVAAGFTLAAASGMFYRAEQALADSWYQKSQALSGNMVLVGIDQRALDSIGPYQQWGREVIADAVKTLNQSEDCHPAVIGIDVLYTGKTQAEADERLARAAGQYGNVVVACAAEFGSSPVPDGDSDYRMDRFFVQAFDEPYEALKNETEQGHINAMMDRDGILRHHLLEIRLPDKKTVPSLSLVVAKKYAESKGEELLGLPPTDSRGFWYLPFSGAPGHFDESISIADVISRQVPAEYFNGKIVLIGPYAAGLQDSYLTAIDHARPMYGVEYQANAVQALLDGDFKKEAGVGWQLAVLFAALMVSAAVFWKRPAFFSTMAWLFVSGGYLILCRWLYNRGVVLKVLWIPVGMTVLYGGSLVFNYGQAALEKRRVEKTFKRYVAPEIVNELMKEGSKALNLGGEMTEIAVIFVDIRGFTPMSEALTPDQVVKILNQYLTLVSECILKNGGTLDKFVGDAAMAFWGAPLTMSPKECAGKAVRAAMDMVEGSRELSEELETKYGRTVSFGVGIHMGNAVVGNIGSPRRMDYTAIGDTVNTAARLESKAPPGKIYISRAVANILEWEIDVTSLGNSVELKGKAAGFEVLTLDRIRRG